MSALPTATCPDIESIQKKHVDTQGPHSGVPARPARVSPDRERNRWAIGKNRQKQIRAAFDLHGTDTERGHVAKMASCLTTLEYRECPAGHEGRLHRTQFCGNRLCPICQKRRAILGKRKYRPAMTAALSGAYSDGRPMVAMFVTVNWPSVADLQEDIVSRMWGDLGKLRRQKWWRERVTSELWSHEWTFSPAFGHHPHSHGLILIPADRYEACVARYRAEFRECPALRKLGVTGREQAAFWWAENGPIPKPMLSNAWKKLTGAYVVDARLIRPRKKDWGNQAALDAALDECLKYPMKENDYLEDRKLRPEEIDEMENTGICFDREEALVQLYRAIRGRRLSDVRGSLRGHLTEAMKEAEEATSNDLLHMDADEFSRYGTQCTCCGREYVERTYHYSPKHGSYFLGAENPLGTAPGGYDSEARNVIQMDLDRQTARMVAKAAGRAWTQLLHDSRRIEARRKSKEAPQMPVRVW